jgi:RNA-directed DNA polymerase
MSLNRAHLTARARADRTLRFTALAHHMTVEYLAETWDHLNRRGAAGGDCVTVAAYAAALPQRRRDLQHRWRQHTYRAPAVHRVCIPKPGQPHKQRPLGIPTIEDRLVQGGVARMLSATY